MSEFQVGDFLYYEFQLCQVKTMEGERITEVSDGMFCTGGHDLSDFCFPLSLRNKIISEFFDGRFHALHKHGLSSLNYPDIKRHLVGRWYAACKLDDDRLKEIYGEVETLVKDILDYCDAIEAHKIQGIQIIRS